MTISGIAGITPDISVYRHAACGSVMPVDAEPAIGGQVRGVRNREAVGDATMRPPIDENACV